jgi:putative membrane protein
VADPVKQYGARMVEDHKPMLEELRALGKKKGLTVPTAPDDKHMAAMKRLQQQSGKTFDRSYMTTMVQDHRATLDLLEEIVDKGKDPDLQAAARKAMPKVQAHLDAAKELAGKTELPERVYQNPPKGS